MQPYVFVLLIQRSAVGKRFNSLIRWRYFTSTFVCDPVSSPEVDFSVNRTVTQLLMFTLHLTPPLRDERSSELSSVGANRGPSDSQMSVGR